MLTFLGPQSLAILILESTLPPEQASTVDELGGLDLRFRGLCVHSDRAVDLARYPNLTYAPAQWGDGVRTATQGTPVAEIAKAVQESGLMHAIDVAAASAAIPLDELLDAIRYARSRGLV